MTGNRGGPGKTVWALVAGAFPALAVATLIPLVLFYVVLYLGSVEIAIGVSAVYAYSVGLWQYRRRSRVSGMLMITMFMVTVRVLAATASGQPFFYFAAPVVETVGFGLLFLVSLATRESLVVRLARDVVPQVADDLAERVCLCRMLSVIWALTYIGSGTTTFFLLITQPLPVYLGAHQLTGWAWSGSGLAASILLCRWRARGLLHTLLHPAAPVGAGPGPLALDVMLPAPVPATLVVSPPLVLGPVVI